MNASKKLVLAALVLFSMTATATADSGNFIGLRGGFYTDIEKPFIGAEYLTGLAPSFDFNPNIEYILVDEGTLISFNIDAHYDFYNGRKSFIYFGGGLAINYASANDVSSTDTGANLLLGMGILGKSVIPYLQAKMVLAEESELVVGFGVRF